MPRILLIDDEPRMLSLLNTILKGDGYTLVSVRPTPSSAFPRGRDLFEISGLHRLPVSRKEFFQVVIGVVHDPPQHIL